MTNPAVSVVIIVRNMQYSIEDCLKSLIEQTLSKEKYEVIVVDNNSTDNTRETVKKYPVKLVLEEEVGNFGGARNRGIREARGKIVAFIDADCVADKDWIEKILAAHSSCPDLAGVGGGNYNPYPENKVARTLAYAQNGHWCTNAPRRVVNFLPGCNCSYKKDVVERIGMFPEGTASEDMLLGAKMCAARQVLLFNPKLRVKHDFERTLGSLAKKEERCGKGHFNIHFSAKRISLMRLTGSVLFSPWFAVGRSATGFLRVIRYSERKQDAIILMPYLLYSGFFWTRGYLRREFELWRKQKSK